MDANKPDDKADIETAIDRGERDTAMEPLLVRGSSKHRGELVDLALELTQESTALSKSLPPHIASSLAALVRAMNCYYSNLIEGHDTHPIDIERALNEDYSADPKKRDLQLEAKAHIDAQRWIDEGGLPGSPFTGASVLALHERFCSRLPEDLLWVVDPDSDERVKVTPGAFRTRDVRVGQHIAVSPGAVPRFMQRFENVYSTLGKTDTILASASAHHRLLWVHPFMDGNGRVARLMSYAVQRDAISTEGIWSIARGLARNIDDYRTHLAACDEQRHGDLDGRGNLSEARLAEFTRFFLKACLDQVAFMSDLIQPDRLRARILIWVEEEMRVDALPARCDEVLSALLYRGMLPRAAVAELLGTSDRQARRVSSALLKAGVMTSKSPRAPLHLAFPARLASRWMPGLFPDKLGASA